MKTLSEELRNKVITGMCYTTDHSYGAPDTTDDERQFLWDRMAQLLDNDIKVCYSPKTLWRFNDRVYTSVYQGYYDKYRGHQFFIDHYSHEDEENQHVWLICDDDPVIKVSGYVELCNLIQIKE
jgi:hypothetical protein